MARFLNRFLRHWSDAHLSDGEIFAVIESTAQVSLSSRREEHLKVCWKCQARKQHLQDTILKVVDYERVLLAPFLPPPPHAEGRLIARLDMQSAPAAEHSIHGWGIHLPNFAELRMNPSFATALVVLLAVGLIFAIWRRPPVAVPSPHEFLEGVHSFDQAQVTGKPSVAFQRVAIRAPQGSLERNIYFDLQHRRRAKVQKTDAAEETIREELTKAGVDWEEPLSGASFLKWHNEAPIRAEKVIASGKDLFTLTTALGPGSIADESLTVRQSDFHPVARTIEFRDSGTVEIAELDYAVLDWNAINDSIFEPSSALESNHPAPALVLPSLPSRETLDQAELHARVVLNRLDADSTESLEFSRSEDAVHIEGVVETDARKGQLLAALRAIPHVNASIFSVEDLSAHGVNEPAANSVAGGPAGEIVGPSPLSAYLLVGGASQETANQTSKQLLDAALGVQQESSAISDLLWRFSGEPHLSESGRVDLAELLTRHFVKLDNMLAIEGQVLHTLPAAAGSPLQQPSGERPTEAMSLVAAAVRNRALVTELISGSKPSSREAGAIISDLLESMADVRRIAQTTKKSGLPVAISGSVADR